MVERFNGTLIVVLYNPKSNGVLERFNSTMIVVLHNPKSDGVVERFNSTLIVGLQLRSLNVILSCNFNILLYNNGLCAISTRFGHEQIFHEANHREIGDFTHHYREIIMFTMFHPPPELLAFYR